MKRLIALLGLLPTAAWALFAAGYTTVTATVTDTDGQAWTNGTWTAELVKQGGPFSGTLITAGGAAVRTPLKGNLDSNGVLTTTLTDTSTMDQAGVKWKIIVCPNASVSPYGTTGCAIYTTAVTGTTLNLTSKFSGVDAPRFPAGTGAYGYADGEVIAPQAGATYFNTSTDQTLAGLRMWDGKRWVAGGGGSGGGGTIVPSPQYQLPFFNTPGSNKSIAGDTGVSTDGAGNLALKSINGRPFTSGSYTFSQAQGAGQYHPIGTLTAGGTNPCFASHGTFLDSLGGVQECFNGALGFSPSRPSYQASFYGQPPSGVQGNGNQAFGVFCGDTEPGWSIGTVSHVTGAFWRASGCVRHSLFTSSQGIKELTSTGSVTTALGDTTFSRNFWQAAAGYTAGSDEGIVGQYNSLSEVPSWYGNADANATPGASSIMTTSGRTCGTAQLGTGQCYGQGRWLVRQAYLLKTSMTAVTGPSSSNVDGTMTVTGGLTPSTAIGFIQSTNISATMSLSRAANGYVTATLISGDITRMKGNYDTFNVTGCSDSTFNGAQVAADRNTTQLFWSTTTLSAGTCPSATVTLTSVPQTTNLAVLGVPDTITVGTITGTTGFFRASGVACIGGTQNESVSYTSTPISGGLQTLVITHRFPHDVGTRISDGACKVVSIDADYIPNAYSHASWVVTSIPSSTSLTWSNSYGGNALGSSLVTGGTAWVPATAITTVSIVRSAGSSTATVTPISGADPALAGYGAGRSLTVSGCTDTSFNGTFVISGGNSYPRNITYPSTASTASSCASASVNVSGNDGITLWEGARVWNTKDPNVTPYVNGNVDPRQTGWMGLEANEANWQPNELLEQMTNPNMVYTLRHDLCGKTTQDGAATASACQAIDLRGSIRRLINIGFYEPLTSYYGFGGSFAAPDVIFAAGTGAGAGVYNTLFNASKAPVTGLLEIGPCLGSGTCKYDIFNGYNAGRITTDTSTNTIEVIANNIKLSGAVAFGSAITAPTVNSSGAVNATTTVNATGFVYSGGAAAGAAGGLQIMRNGNGSGNSVGFVMCENQYTTDFALCMQTNTNFVTQTNLFDYVPASANLNGNSLTADFFRANYQSAYTQIAESTGVTGTMSATYSGTTCASGCDILSYFPVVFVNGLPGRYADNGYKTIKVNISNAQPLSSSNTVTINCVNMAVPYLGSGATVHIIRRVGYGAHGFFDVGDCTGTKSIVDNGSATTNLGQYGSNNTDLAVANGISKAGVFGSYGVMGFWSDLSGLATVDSALSRTGAATMALGNGTKGDSTGTLQLATLSANFRSPKTIYTAAGTPLPTCAAGLKGTLATVGDATSPSYMGAYASGGGVTADVICSYNGTTYAWLTH